MLFAGAQMASAQETELVSKKGIKILPQQGDIALGLDATPFFGYLGNFFSQSGNNYIPELNGVNQTIYLKYFLTSKSALRLSLGFDFRNYVEKGLVPDDYATMYDPLNPNPTAIDVMTNSQNEFNLTVGYELRRGRGRVQGFYGVQAGFGFSSGKEKYTYANPMTDANQTPSTSYIYGSGYYSATTRPLEMKNPRSLTAGLGGFVGVEYFFAPSISLAGELGLGWIYTWHNQGGQNYETVETYNPALGTIKLEQRTNGYGNYNNRGILGTQTYANIAVLFHF